MPKFLKLLQSDLSFVDGPKPNGTNESDHVLFRPNNVHACISSYSFKILDILDVKKLTQVLEDLLYGGL